MELLRDTNVVLNFLGGDERMIKLFSRAKRLAVSLFPTIEEIRYITFGMSQFNRLFGHV